LDYPRIYIRRDKVTTEKIVENIIIDAIDSGSPPS
jgi:hypothetical protein